mgnify:CR=1 FL=1
MVKVEDYGKFETAWCPGCGNFKLLDGVKQGLVQAGLEPHQVLFVSGIGQAAKAPHYLRANVFNGLHGRGVPAATGAALALSGVKVIVESGDGCCYGEGGNHFLAAIRRNVDITMLVHDNMIYALTKGQASPTTEEGRKTKTQPEGSNLERFDPVTVAVAMHAGFVARSFVGEQDHLAGMIERALEHRGFSLVDIFQPCVSFNHVNTFKWFRDRCYTIGEEHDPSDHGAAMKLAAEWGDRIPIGLIYRNDRTPLDARIPALEDGGLVGREVDLEKLAEIFGRYM